MGVFRHDLEVASAKDGAFHRLSALVDAGSLYTWIPAPLPGELGLTPMGTMPFRMADGTAIRPDFTEARVRLAGSERHTIVVFGAPRDEVLLGAYTLEGFGLCADSVNRRLVPMELIPAVSANPPLL